MKRAFAGLLGSALAATIAAGCGGGREAARHETTPQAAAAEPTPDTTPVEALRTPAGLALKPESAATPPAGATPSSTQGGAAAGPTAAARPTP